MGKDSLKFTKGRQGKGVPRRRELNIKEIYTIKKMAEGKKKKQHVEEAELSSKTIEIETVEEKKVKVPDFVKEMYQRLGLPTEYIKLVKIKKKEHLLGKDVPFKPVPINEKVGTYEKKMLLLDLLTKQRMGLFDVKPATDLEKESINMQKKALERLLNDPNITVSDEEISKYVDLSSRIKIIGFPQYYRRLPPLSTKKREKETGAPRSKIMFIETMSIINEMNNLLHTEVHVPSMLRKVVRRSLCALLFDLFKVDETDVQPSRPSVNENSGHFKPYLEPVERYLERQFREWCRVKNAELKKTRENEEGWDQYQSIVENKEPTPQYKAPSSLLDDLLQATQPKEEIVKPVPLSVTERKAQVLLDRFLATHPRFYSLYSFVAKNDQPFTGIYEILVNQPDKNAVDVFVLQSIERRGQRYTDVISTSKQQFDYFDPNELNTMQRKTNTFLRQIFLSYVDTNPSLSVIEEYLTQPRAKDCNEYRTEWYNTESYNATQEWLMVADQYVIDEKAWKENQQQLKLSSKKRAEFNYNKELKDNIVSEVEELEKNVYETSDKLVTSYLPLMSAIMVPLEENEVFGRHARIFRLKVLEDVYPVRYLNKLSVSDIYPELLMNEKLYGDEFSTFDEALQKSITNVVRELLGRYLFNINPTSKRSKEETRAMLLSKKEKAALKKEDLDVIVEAKDPLEPYVVVPQKVCSNTKEAENIHDDDLVVCRYGNEFVCHSLSKLEMLFLKNDNPIDPYTSKPFSKELIEKIKDRI